MPGQPRRDARRVEGREHQVCGLLDGAKGDLGFSSMIEIRHAFPVENEETARAGAECRDLIERAISKRKSRAARQCPPRC